MLWGKFISLDDSTSSKKRFDVGKVLISTSCMEVISKLTMKINGEFYNIKCVEEEHSNNVFIIRSNHVLNSMSSSDHDSESWSLGLMEAT